METDWKAELKETLLLGSKNFVEQMTSLLKGDRREQTAVRQASVGRLAWPAITAAISEQWGQDWETLQAGHGNAALAAALYLGRQYSDKTLRELGQLAGGMQYPAVTMAIRRFAKRLEADNALTKKMKELTKCCLLRRDPTPARSVVEGASPRDVPARLGITRSGNCAVAIIWAGSKTRSSQSVCNQ